MKLAKAQVLAIYFGPTSTPLNGPTSLMWCDYCIQQSHHATLHSQLTLSHSNLFTCAALGDPETAWSGGARATRQPSAFQIRTQIRKTQLSKNGKAHLRNLPGKNPGSCFWVERLRTVISSHTSSLLRPTALGCLPPPPSPPSGEDLLLLSVLFAGGCSYPYPASRSISDKKPERTVTAAGVRGADGAKLKNGTA
jgi:hypothetical protein